MVSWSDLEQREPELAARVRAIFGRQVHKTMATLRRDGSPRISATEVDFFDGEMWLGSMWQARKALDLVRDPRVAIHSGSIDPGGDDRGVPGDAKVAGRALVVDDPAAVARVAEKAPPGPFHLFRVDVDEAVVSGVGGDPPDHMVIDFWTVAAGRQTVKRA
jgi:pyridoxamine 5'-phosphate oxidase-like protein